MSTGEARWDAGDEEAAPGLPAFVTDPWGVARRRWPWMLGALVLGLAATLVVYALWKPRYVA